MSGPEFFQTRIGAPLLRGHDAQLEHPNDNLEALMFPGGKRDELLRLATARRGGEWGQGRRRGSIGDEIRDRARCTPTT